MAFERWIMDLTSRPWRHPEETQHLGIKAKLIQHSEITSTMRKMSEDPVRDQMTNLGAFPQPASVLRQTSGCKRAFYIQYRFFRNRLKWRFLQAICTEINEHIHIARSYDMLRNHHDLSCWSLKLVSWPNVSIYSETARQHFNVNSPQKASYCWLKKNIII